MTDSLQNKALSGIRNYTGGHILIHAVEVAIGALSGIYAADPVKGMLLGAFVGASMEVTHAFLFGEDSGGNFKKHLFRDAFIKGALLGGSAAVIGKMSGIHPVPIITYDAPLAINASNITSGAGALCNNIADPTCLIDPSSPNFPAAVYYNPASPMSVYNY